MVIFHSSGECPLLVTLPKVWHATQAVSIVALASPSGNTIGARLRAGIASWLRAGIATTTIAAKIIIHTDFADIAPPSSFLFRTREDRIQNLPMRYKTLILRPLACRE